MYLETCANLSPVIRYNITLHFALCGKKNRYTYEIKLRGVNRISMPSVHSASSAQKIHQMKNMLINEYSNYRFIEGHWSDPKITNYECFPLIGRFFSQIFIKVGIF